MCLKPHTWWENNEAKISTPSIQLQSHRSQLWHPTVFKEGGSSWLRSPKSHREVCLLSQNLGKGSPEAIHLRPVLNFNRNFWLLGLTAHDRCLLEVRDLSAKQGTMEGLSVYFDKCKWILLLVKMLSRPWWNDNTPPPLLGWREKRENNVRDRLLWSKWNTYNFGGEVHYFRDLGILANTFIN